MSNSVSTMKNFFNVLKLYANDTTTNGVEILDHAVRTVSHFAGLQDAVNNFLTDIANVTATSGAGQSLYQNCGIILGAPNDFSVDTGAVSGLNAGMGVLKDAQSIVPEPNVNLSELALPAEGSKVVKSYTGADGNVFYYTVTYPTTYLTVRDNATSPLDEDGEPDSSRAQSTTLQAGQTYQNEKGTYTTTGTQAAAAIQTMLRGVDNYWISESLKLAYDSFGLDFNNKNLTIIFGINQDSQAETGPEADDTAGRQWFPASNIGMEINLAMYAMIDPNNPNGTTRVENGSCQNYLDRTIAHELIHATMQASGTSKSGMPEFFTEGVAELVHGCDDYDSQDLEDLVALAQDPNRLATAMAFKSGTGTPDAYPAGDMFLRYLCKQSEPVNVQIGTGNPQTFTHAATQDVISAYKSSDQINAAAGVKFGNVNLAGEDAFISSNLGTVIIRDAKDKFINLADSAGAVVEHVSFSSGAGTTDGRGFVEYEIFVGANEADNTLIAGNGGSQLWGGDYGNDILYGGGGADVFVTGVLCGNDTIYNANAEDTIYLGATNIEQVTGASVNSGGVSLNFSDGSSLNVVGNVGAKFVLSNGVSFKADQSTGGFTNA